MKRFKLAATLVLFLMAGLLVASCTSKKEMMQLDTPAHQMEHVG
ncbi:MAG TPA: hypothetical protein VL359_20480 [bacterium]|nr:hypothetical protein [bacterium]